MHAIRQYKKQLRRTVQLKPEANGVSHHLCSEVLFGKTSSGVQEQPFGYEEISKGVHNRLEENYERLRSIFI